MRHPRRCLGALSHVVLGSRSRVPAGYAESSDGITWQRQDSRAGLPVSSEGWDSEMIAYGIVFRHGEALQMLYNGNGYGRTGIGIATLS